jgi:hypothetical protein
MSQLLSPPGIGLFQAVCEAGPGFLHYRFLVRDRPTLESQAGIGYVMGKDKILAG